MWPAIPQTMRYTHRHMTQYHMNSVHMYMAIYSLYHGAFSFFLMFLPDGIQRVKMNRGLMSVLSNKLDRIPVKS